MVNYMIARLNNQTSYDYWSMSFEKLTKLLMKHLKK